MAKKGSKKERKAKLGRKLAGYSAAAGAALALGATGANAAPLAPVYNFPASLTIPGWTSSLTTPVYTFLSAIMAPRLQIDLNNSTKKYPDVGFGLITQTSRSQSGLDRMTMMGNNGFVLGTKSRTNSMYGIRTVSFAVLGSTGTNAFVAKRFTSPSTNDIANNKDFRDFGFLGASVVALNHTASGKSYWKSFYKGGSFLDATGYLGIKTIDFDNTTHYGWVDLGMNSNATSMTINGYYWNDTPAGSPVPEPGTLALLAIGAAGLAALRRKKITDEASA